MDFFRFGLEREALRVTPEGRMALTDHPRVFGNKLTHPMITTDFLENQMEFVTPVFGTIDEAIESLHQIMAWSQQHLENELLWPLSMPPDMDPDGDIRLASYGESPEGRIKEIYRKGLAFRYGKGIQSVSGVHLNVSFTDALFEAFGNGRGKDELYMGLVRNFLRWRFLLVYAYGASPIAGKGYPFRMEIEKHCPTSIRMSRYGYSNTRERGFLLSYDSVEEYVSGLRTASSTPHPDYIKIGTHRNGEQVQLNTNILQMPAEYYSPVRIKPMLQDGEDLLDALESKGIQRIEFRAFDVYPFCVTGVEQKHLDFFLVFLLACLSRKSPPLNADERVRVNALQRKVALCGRMPEVSIECDGKEMPVSRACECFCEEMKSVALWLDGEGGERYQESLQSYCDRLKTGRTVSSKMVEEMETGGLTHQEYGTRLAGRYREELMGVHVSGELRRQLEKLSMPS